MKTKEIVDTHLKLAEEKYPYAENGYYDFEYKDQVNTLREAFIAGMQEAQQAGEGLREALEEIVMLKKEKQFLINGFIQQLKDLRSLTSNFSKQETEKS